MAGKLHDRVLLVTGGLSGIGAAACASLAAEGAKVVAGDIAAGEAGLSDAPVALLRLDVADAESVGQAIDALLVRHGRIDGVLHCAGLGHEQAFVETPIEAFDRIVAVNLRGTFLVAQAAAKAMIPRGGGAIVNLASVSGMIGSAGRSAYGASKGGVIALSQVMAVELAQHAIRVNVISPGPVETPMVTAMHSAATRAEWVRCTPMRRYGTAAEIAASAAYLLSDDASYVTGQVLTVDGGFLAQGLGVPSG